MNVNPFCIFNDALQMFFFSSSKAEDKSMMTFPLQTFIENWRQMLLWHGLAASLNLLLNLIQDIIFVKKALIIKNGVVEMLKMDELSRNICESSTHPLLHCLSTSKESSQTSKFQLFYGIT